MILGCSTILYGGHSLDTALKGIEQAGYGAIELCAIPGMAPHISCDMSRAEIRAVKAKIEDSGLAIESIGASGNPFVSDEPGEPPFTKLMQVAAELDAPALATGSGGTFGDENSFKETVARIQETAAIAADLGVKISIKPHVGAAVASTPTALRFMEEVDPKWVGLNVDASHLWRGEPWEVPEESIPKLAPYFVTARIRDTHEGHERPIGSVESQIPGQGGMNLPAICAALNAVPGLQCVTLEIVGTKEFARADVQRVAEESKAYLDGCF